MKENFQETIKQKTDRELEVISKDYAFYSEKERFVAIKELEFRNSLTKELLAAKSRIENSIDTEPIITEQVSEAVKSQKGIYKAGAIWVGTYLGGPLVAGYLIAENFKIFNEVNNAKKTWIYAIIGTILVFVGIFFIPDNVRIPNFLIPSTYTLVAYIFVEYFQKRNISAYVALNGKVFSWWRIVAISLIGVAISFVLIYIIAIIMDVILM